MTDNINNPAHYTAGGIETIDVIEGVLGKYDHRDQVEKYNQRAHLKGNFQQDLEKARWYLNRTIENCEKGKLDPVTGAPVDTAEEPAPTFYPTELDTESVYTDAVRDAWVYNYPDEKWYFYTLRDGEVVRKSVRGFTQEMMVFFTRDFFTRVEYKLPILLAVARFEDKEREEDDKKFDTATVHKDNDGDYWVFNDSIQAWKWYTLSEDLSSVEYYGGTFTAEEIEKCFDTTFIKPVALMRTERLVREAVEKFENPEPRIVLGETDPEDMPVGTVAYRDGERFSYNARKAENGWVLSHQPIFYYSPNEVAANWFKHEEGWSLEKPSDVYKDDDGDYWAHSDDGWRWHHISNGELVYRSIRTHEFEDIKDTYSLEKLSDDEARRVRLIIREGEK